MEDEAYNKRDELLAKYITRLPLGNHTDKPFVIGLMGLVGSGKSTVAAEIEKRFGILVGSNDDIRRFLNEEGYGGAAPVQQTLQYIAEAASDYLYAHNVSHIIDADLFKFAARAKERAERNGFRFVLVEVACPEEIIRERIIQRSKDIEAGNVANASRAGIEDFEQRKEVWATMEKPKPDAVIWTDKPLEPQLSELAEILQIA